MKITLLKSFLLVGALLCLGFAQAQEITGNVSDANGPLPGASVVEKGTTNGTQTDFDGNYILTVGENATLVISYIGYSTTEIAVNGRSTVDVTLAEDAQALDEVVIIGYGTTTVKDATGSVSSVTAKDFNGGVIASAEQLIQGKSAGVNISQTSGEPGAGISVNIRGSNSVRANNNPLFVVDGVPLSGDSTSPSGDSGLGATAVRNPLNFLNPADIMSISILKDASATAIYGSRGANGVVIITTKSGKAAGEGVLEFSTSLSVAKPAKQYDLLNKSEFLSAVTQFGGDAGAVNFGATTNWQDFITRSTASTNNNLSYSKNYGKGHIRATFGYQKQFGVVEKTDLERITGRLNITQRLFDDKLTLKLSGTISRVNDETAPLSATAGFRGDILGASYSANPTWPSSPSFTDGGTQILPANLLAFSQNRTNTDRFLLNASAEYKITPELTGKLNGGYDKSESENVSVISSDVQNLNGIEGVGFGVYNRLERENKLLEATINYKKEFENSSLDILAGYSFQDFQSIGRNAQGRGFQTKDLNQMGSDLRATVNDAEKTLSGSYQQFFYGTNSAGLVVNRLFPNVVAGEVTSFGFNKGVDAMTADLFDNTDELQSFFGRVNYSLADKYLFTATMRADGSSRFGPENQYGYFPSGAFAWKLNEENFVGNNVSTLKLRLSGGLVGSQDGLGYGNFVARQRFAGVGTNTDLTVNGSGLTIVATDVPSLKWEETLSINAGIDLGFNVDRFTASIDVYKSETTDVLLRTPPASPAIDPFQFGNVDAKIVNQGIELAMGYDFIQSEDVTLSASFNIAYNENEVQDFGGAINTGQIRGQGLSGAFAQRFEAGHPLYSYYMAEFAGLDADGQPTFVDQNGDGVGDVFQDKVFVGENALPDYTGGLSLNLRIKDFDFSSYFSGQSGFSVYNNTRNGIFTSGSITNARNVTRDLVSSGEAAGTSADVSTRYLEKGDFIRFQNATLGYNVPLTGEGLFRSMRLTITGQNLFLITDYSGLDPEVTVATGDLGSGVPSRGIDWAAFPNPRTFTFGINASF